MARQRNKNRVFSSISDNRLAMILATEFAVHPEDFSSISSNEIEDKVSFLKNTAGRGIEPMKRWL